MTFNPYANGVGAIHAMPPIAPTPLALGLDDSSSEPWGQWRSDRMSPEGETSMNFQFPTAFDVSPAGLMGDCCHFPRFAPWATICRPPG